MASRNRVPKKGGPEKGLVCAACSTQVKPWEVRRHSKVCTSDSPGPSSTAGRWGREYTRDVKAAIHIRRETGVEVYDPDGLLGYTWTEVER